MIYICRNPYPLGNLDFISRALCVATSFFIYGLCAFLYVVFIFGPSETSIRIRLARELYRVFPRGMTLEEILRSYNSDVMLKMRLLRLIDADVLSLNGRIYQNRKNVNIFSFIDWVILGLKKAYGVKIK